MVGCIESALLLIFPQRQRSGQLFNEIAGGGFLVFCCGNRERESSEEIKNLLDEVAHPIIFIVEHVSFGS